MTAIRVPAGARLGGAWRILADEAGKGLQLMWQRRAMLVVAAAAQGFTYLMIEFLIGGGRLDHAVLALTLPAYFAFSLAGTAAMQGSGGIAEEVNAGTLEQSHLSPARPTLLMAGRLAALATEGLLPAAVVTAAFWAGYGVRYQVRPDVLLPLLLTIIDALAYALLMAALTLRVASIGAVVHVFNMAIMFFAGMFVPVTIFPHGVEIFARLIPTTLGVLTINSALAGRPLSAAWADGTLPWLLAHVAVLSALAWATYLHTLRRARREGGLSPR
ncbi:MAG TPA: ABC transporter permease [Streptosporangiaceae bacterium]|nr:ABC transporter permease [Streptosporangiaceae bacterium]